MFSEWSHAFTASVNLLFISLHLDFHACCDCRARDELDEERLARIDAEDIVSKLQEQLADVQNAEVTARQAAETRLSSLTQEYESLRDQVTIDNYFDVLCILVELLFCFCSDLSRVFTSAVLVWSCTHMLACFTARHCRWQAATAVCA